MLRQCAWFLPLLAALSAGSASAFTTEEVDSALAAAAVVEETVRVLASDEFAGRDNLGLGSALAQDYLIDRLALLGDGIDPLATGEDAYRQPFADGTNLIAVIPGRELPQEFVVVGAHYDHLSGFDCFFSPVAASSVCNGAQDNAAGVAAVLAIGEAIRALPTPPRRSVVLALWDAEEDSLLGSKFFVGQATLPLGNIVGYVNFDIQGTNLLPSARDISFAIGAETGGSVYQQIVGDAVDEQELMTTQLSVIFGQNRSDHASFYLRGVPSVFFTDANGGCYHTAGDEADVVDYQKLAQQSQIGFRTTLSLAEGDALPSTPPIQPPLVTYDDVVSIANVLTPGLADLSLFPFFLRSRVVELEASFRSKAEAGPEAFDVGDTFTILNEASEIVSYLTEVPCDGFLPEPDTDGDGVIDRRDNCPGDPNTEQQDGDMGLVILRRAGGFDLIDPGEGINRGLGIRNRGLLRGEGVEFSCDVCADATFQDAASQIGGELEICGYTDRIPRQIVANDDALCVRGVSAGPGIDLDLISFRSDSGGCVDADGGASCEVSQDETSYRRGDGVGDACDNCPNALNRDQVDTDGNGLGDACQDSDGDDVPDGSDNCLDVANPLQENTDRSPVLFVNNTGAPDPLEPMASIRVGLGPIAGDGVEFACGTCDVASFDELRVRIGGGTELCGYPAAIPRQIVRRDDQLCARAIASGNLYELDLLSFRSDSSGCTDADGGASCAAAGGRTSYVRQARDEFGDACDNCPAVVNAGQEDADNDGFGDACDLPECDVDLDGDIDQLDIEAIFDARGSPAIDGNDPRDANRDGLITINDGRLCVLDCDEPNCASPPVASDDACGLTGSGALALAGGLALLRNRPRHRPASRTPKEATS